MAKRFYKKNEFVFVKPLKRKGKVVELKPQELKAVVSVVVGKERTPNGKLVFENKEFTFMELDKLGQNHEKNKEKKDTVLFAKVKENAIIPSKNFEDGGYDVYACLSEGQEIVIQPNSIVLIPTGIASSLLPKYRFVFKERGSTGTRGLSIRSGVIDSGYRGQWFVALNNTSNKTIVITNTVNKIDETSEAVLYPVTKAIAQANLQIVPDVYTKEITIEELEKIPSVRGKGKLGDSGK